MFYGEIGAYGRANQTNNHAKVQQIPQIRKPQPLNYLKSRGKCPFLKKVDSVCWFNLGWLTLCLRVVV